ncbi:hypothetical protein, partial [Escherichia coli]
ARGVDDADQLRAFVVSEDRMKEAFGHHCRMRRKRLIRPTYSSPQVG